MSMWHTKAVLKAEEQTLDLEGDVIKIMLCAAAYEADQDDEFIDEGDAGTDDAIDGEIAVTGYTGGFGGAGRKTLAGKALTEVALTNRVQYDATDPTSWTLAAGATITQGVLVKEVTNDAASLVIVTLTWAGVATNGGDFTVSFNALGIGYDTMS